MEQNHLCNSERGHIYAILKEGIKGNIHVKLFEIGPLVQEDMLFKEKVYGRTMDDAQRMTDKDGSQ